MKKVLGVILVLFAGAIYAQSVKGVYTATLPNGTIWIGEKCKEMPPGAKELLGNGRLEIVPITSESDYERLKRKTTLGRAEVDDGKIVLRGTFYGKMANSKDLSTPIDRTKMGVTVDNGGARERATVGENMEGNERGERDEMDIPPDNVKNEAQTAVSIAEKSDPMTNSIGYPYLMEFCKRNPKYGFLVFGPIYRFASQLISGLDSSGTGGITAFRNLSYCTSIMNEATFEDEQNERYLRLIVRACVEKYVSDENKCLWEDGEGHLVKFFKGNKKNAMSLLRPYIDVKINKRLSLPGEEFEIELRRNRAIKLMATIKG